MSEVKLIPIDDNRIANAVMLIDAWADAIRGDWGSIDGRSSRSQLWEISSYLRGSKEKLTADDIGICLEGGAHWFYNGFDHNCEEV